MLTAELLRLTFTPPGRESEVATVTANNDGHNICFDVTSSERLPVSGVDRTEDVEFAILLAAPTSDALGELRRAVLEHIDSQTWRGQVPRGASVQLRPLESVEQTKFIGGQFDQYASRIEASAIVEHP